MTTWSRPPRRVLRALAAVLVAGLAAGGCGVDADTGEAVDDGRLLVVALPGLAWDDLVDHELPAIEGVLASGSVAAMSPRSVRANSRPGDAYLTVGAGSRAVGELFTDGTVLAVDQLVGGEPAASVFERRTGQPADGAAAALSWPTLERANGARPFDAVLGLLAESLSGAGVPSAVIANADGSDTTAVSHERQAAYAFVGGDGLLESGSVGAGLNRRDPTRAFGVRLDDEAVVEAFGESWHGPGRRTVLVEASDLARAIRYRGYVTAARYADIWAEALADADALVAQLLAEVDPIRDRVLVVAPYHEPWGNGLTVVGLSGPGIDSGYLRSASTQRVGILTLVDVAPTILQSLGVDRPNGMEGRPAEVVVSSASYTDRVDRLVGYDAASRFRENLLTPTTIVLVLVLALVVAALVVGVAGGRGRRWHATVAFVALADLAALPVSYLLRALPLEQLGMAVYWAGLAGGAVAVAAAAWTLGCRLRRPWVALASVLAVNLVVLVGDVTTGSNLNLGAAFGYSSTGNSRMYGISNYAFGQLAAATCLLAALIAWRWPGRRGVVAAMALMTATLVVLGVPGWGSDVGGVIAFTPTLLVLGGVLTGVRPRIRYLVLGLVASVLAVVVFGLVDLARPPVARSHLGRLFERIGDEGLGPLLSIVERKSLANLRVSTSSFWVAAVPLALATWGFLRWWGGRPLRALHDRIPTLHAGLLAATVAAVLGSAANDSGAIVGGVVSLVLATSLAFLIGAGADDLPELGAARPLREDVLHPVRGGDPSG